jgi:outer membrane protein assembly factor BamD
MIINDRLSRRTPCWPAILSLSLLLAGACADKAQVSTVKVSYSYSAQKNYDKGLKAIKSKSWEEATKYLKFVRAKFPFSKYATLAELRLADVLRGEDKFLSAVDAYKTFEKEHPTHPDVESGYTAYHAGLCYFRLTPSDFFILPPSQEKDMTSAEAALEAFREFFKKYPDSPYKKDARRYHERTLRLLAGHELYVARFYLGRSKPKGAISRLEYLIRKYPDAGLEPETMFLLGRTYLKLKEPRKALGVFQSLIQKHPDDYNAKKARRYLAFIARHHGLR